MILNIGATHMSSTSVLTSASAATTSIFDTVANTAMTATKLVNSIGTGVNMFDRMMNDMDTNHKKRSILNQATYQKELLENASRDTAKRQALIKKELAEDPVYAALFTENYKELEALLTPPTAE